MGYILLSPKYIKSESEENQIENWHLFKTETLEKDNDDSLDDKLLLNDDDIDDYIIEDIEENEYEKDYITIEDNNIQINKNPQCENEIFSNCIDLESENYLLFKIKYNLQKITGQYLNKFIKEYKKEHDEDDIEEYDFLGVGIYYTDKKRTFFYSDDADIIRIIACMLRRCVCGNCIRTLYSNLDNEDGD